MTWSKYFGTTTGMISCAYMNVYIYIHMHISGWWFGRLWKKNANNIWYILYWECHPKWLIFFRGLGQPLTRYAQCHAVLEDGKIKVDRSTLAQDLSHRLALVLRMDGQNAENVGKMAWKSWKPGNHDGNMIFFLNIPWHGCTFQQSWWATTMSMCFSIQSHVNCTWYLQIQLYCNHHWNLTQLSEYGIQRDPSYSWWTSHMHISCTLRNPKKAWPAKSPTLVNDGVKLPVQTAIYSGFFHWNLHFWEDFNHDFPIESSMLVMR